MYRGLGLGLFVKGYTFQINVTAYLINDTIVGHSFGLQLCDQQVFYCKFWGGAVSPWQIEPKGVHSLQGPVRPRMCSSDAPCHCHELMSLTSILSSAWRILVFYRYDSSFNEGYPQQSSSGHQEYCEPMSQLRYTHCMRDAVSSGMTHDEVVIPFIMDSPGPRMVHG